MVNNTPTDRLFASLQSANLDRMRQALADGACFFTGLFTTSPEPITLLLSNSAPHMRPLWDEAVHHLAQNPAARQKMLDWERHGMSVLHWMTNYPPPDDPLVLLKPWLDQGVPLEAVTYHDSNTALACCHEGWVAPLLAMGANLYARGDNGRTPLYHSARCLMEGEGRAALRVQALMESGWTYQADPCRRHLSTFLRQNSHYPHDRHCDEIYQVLRATVQRTRLTARVRDPRPISVPAPQAPKL